MRVSDEAMRKLAVGAASMVEPPTNGEWLVVTSGGEWRVEGATRNEATVLLDLRSPEGDTDRVCVTMSVERVG